LHAGGVEYMREWEHGTGSWWSYRRESGLRSDSTDSWKLADVFDKHLLDYHLVHETGFSERPLYKVGDIISFDWFNKGRARDHESFIADVKHGEAYLLQHSRDYGVVHSLTWFLKKANQDNPGGVGFHILRPDHTGANIR
jgi:hypothetical protein